MKKRSSLDFHPAPFQNLEQTAIGCTHRIDTNDIRPEHCPVVRGRSRSRLLLKSHVTRGDATEVHEDAGDDVRRGQDAHLRRLLVGRLREETQCGVLVFE